MEGSGITFSMPATKCTDFQASVFEEAIIQSPPLSEVTLKGRIYLFFMGNKDLTDLSLDAMVSHVPESSFSINTHFTESAVSYTRQSHILGKQLNRGERSVVFFLMPGSRNLVYQSLCMPLRSKDSPSNGSIEGFLSQEKFFSHSSHSDIFSHSLVLTQLCTEDPVRSVIKFLDLTFPLPLIYMIVRQNQTIWSFQV